MDTTKEITHLSLCSGYEGIGRGLRAVLPNVREIAYVEIETYCIANLVKEMEAGVLDTAPIYSNLKTFPYGKFRGKVDILSGGFPCQPFSNAGLRQATEDPRHLFPRIREGIRECQPRIVFLENVEGIISAKTADGEPVLKYVLGELEGLGYRATAGIFSASEVGAPHQRKRVFILGVKGELGNACNKRCEQNTALRSEQQASWTNEVSRESRSKLADSENLGCGGRTHRDGDYGSGLQEQEAQEQPNLRSETARCGGDSRGELGDTQHDGHTTPEELRGFNEASDDNPEGQNWSIESKGAGERGFGSSIQGCEELANSRNEGLQGGKLSSTHIGRDCEQEGTYGPATQCSSQKWPSRPGQAQQEWEAPRVVADTESQQGASGNYGSESRETGEPKESKSGGGCSGSLRKSYRQAKPGLGGATDGFTCRVDQLRLLGNGVVPQVASKAFVTLLNRMYE